MKLLKEIEESDAEPIFVYSFDIIARTSNLFYAIEFILFKLMQSKNILAYAFFIKLMQLYFGKRYIV